MVRPQMELRSPNEWVIEGQRKSQHGFRETGRELGGERIHSSVEGVRNK